MQPAIRVLPTLLAVFDDEAFYQRNVASVLDQSYFKRVVRGSTIEDFGATLEGDSDPIVVLVHGRNSNAVLSTACQTKRVQWVHSFNTGIDALRLNTIKEVLAGIPISNARSVFVTPLAEHVVLSCLYFNRRVARIQHNKANRVWDRFSSPEISRQRMCIVGYGDIAKACAKMVRAMGMEVSGLRRSEVPNGSTVDDIGVTVYTNNPDAFDRVLRESDFVLNVMPFTGSNSNLFDKGAFAKMRPDAVFINIGRGATVNEDDLCDALNNNTIKGAALDVFAVEPLPQESPLWSLPDDKILLTPHNADVTHTCMQEAGEYFMALAKDFIGEGKVPEYLVDIDRGY